MTYRTYITECGRHYDAKNDLEAAIIAKLCQWRLVGEVIFDEGEEMDMVEAIVESHFKTKH